ncbi:MAG: 2-oxoglutarate dehydrogenase complex dihydrolipoyllysine-residue succinyltransferase [Chloroflexi bacterium]|nr:2-oxoglutarate dehydrogenase complex dihydrolipoyllysine-residue succinyltransferase [Chloroflexota bacterium]
MSIKIVVPELGESVVEATVGRWLKHTGEQVAAGEPIVELETDKVNLEVSTEQAGVLAQIERQEGEDVQIGDVLGVIETEPAAEKTQPAAEVSQKEPVTVAPEDDSTDEKATPVAKRLAQAHGVDLTQVHGRGPGDRVTKQDVQTYLEGQQPRPETKPGPPPSVKLKVPAEPMTSVPAQPGREERVRMSRRRRTIAQRLVEAQQTAAMLTTFNEIDMSKVMDLRQRRQTSFQSQHGIKLGFMSFFVKATIGALRQFPQLNAEIEGDEIILKHYYDIGMAIGAAEGLVVPVLRDADRMTFAEIEQAIKNFAQATEAGTLSLEDLRGGTFTITNGGVFGSLLSTPILNTPQVGILGLHKIEERPIALNGEVVIRPMTYVALSYDHRIVDGREAVQFLVRVKELIEDPETLLLEG